MHVRSNNLSGCFFLAVVFYFHNNRLLGIKPKLTPKSKSEFLFGVLLAIFFGMIVSLTREFSMSVVWWASYASGAITALVLSYVMYRYPLGDYKTSTDEMTSAKFDPLIHGQNRLQVCAMLALTSEIEFKKLREKLDVSYSKKLIMLT